MNEQINLPFIKCKRRNMRYQPPHVKKFDLLRHKHLQKLIQKTSIRQIRSGSPGKIMWTANDLATE
jgi:hypothetical protein